MKKKERKKEKKVVTIPCVAFAFANVYILISNAELFTMFNCSVISHICILWGTFLLFFLSSSFLIQKSNGPPSLDSAADG
jgi:uncharacterized membrane protein YozB (DUF420 family)